MQFCIVMPFSELFLINIARGSYHTYSSLVKLQTLVSEFAVENLPLGRTVALVPEFAVKDLSLGITLDDDDDDNKGKK